MGSWHHKSVSTSSLGSPSSSHLVCPFLHNILCEASFCPSLPKPPHKRHCWKVSSRKALFSHGPDKEIPQASCCLWPYFWHPHIRSIQSTLPEGGSLGIQTEDIFSLTCWCWRLNLRTSACKMCVLVSCSFSWTCTTYPWLMYNVKPLRCILWVNLGCNRSPQICTSDITGASPSWTMAVEQDQEGA